MSDRDPGHRSRRSARFEIRPTLGRTALFNLVLSGGLLPPPRRCARNEKKDKRSLVEKEIDTGARLIDAIRVSPLDAILVGPLALGFFTVEEDNPYVGGGFAFASTEYSCQFEHRTGARPSIVGTDKVRH